MGMGTSGFRIRTTKWVWLCKVEGLCKLHSYCSRLLLRHALLAGRSAVEVTGAGMKVCDS